MPPLLWAFFIAISLASGSALMGPPRAWDGIDPTTHSHLGKPDRGFQTWLSVPTYQIAGPDKLCHVVAFGVSFGQRIVRVQVDGIEQNADWSWSQDVEAGESAIRHVTFRYLDPLGGAELACHDVHFTCIPENWDGLVRARIAFGKPCLVLNMLY